MVIIERNEQRKARERKRGILKNKDFTMARTIAEEVRKLGGRTFFVGGYVRDQLLAEQKAGTEAAQEDGPEAAQKAGTVTEAERNNMAAATDRGTDTDMAAAPDIDIDIEVHGILPEQLRQILDELGGRTEIGRSFGIYGLKGCALDIAMPRKETATGRGHRDFEVYVDPYLGPARAARRRDFTVNAMMEDVLTGEIVDPYGGQQDLKNSVLRHVDSHSFAEDPLRVLRGAQFAARFGFSIAPETVELCSAMDLTVLPPERIFGELEKALLKAGRPSVFFQSLREMKQLDTWFPELAALIGVEQSPVHHPEGDVWNHTMLVTDQAALLRHGAKYAGAALSPSSDIGFMLAALCHDLGKAVTTGAGEDGRIHAFGHETEGIRIAETFMKRITGNKRLTAYVTNMVRLHMKPNTVAGARSKEKSTSRMFDQSADPEGLLLLARVDNLGRAGAVINEDYENFLYDRLCRYREVMSRPFVRGEDLMKAGMKPGPEFSEMLAYAHKLRLAGIPKEEALRQTLALGRKKEEKS